jgi:DNA-binding LacI/PurR family transcriptional regulator
MSRNPVERARRPTLRDVAHAAGVSVWTVSNAYSNPDRVAPATRERVLAAASAIGYTGPDPVARSLALGRTRIVALVADGDSEPLLADPTAALMARGLIHACDAAGMAVLFTGRVGEAAVDGAVHLRVAPEGPSAHPRVILDAPEGEAGPTVRADVAGAGAAMARHLRELGHRELVILGWPGAGERLDGARAAWGGDDPVSVYMVTGERLGGPTVADGETAARMALSREPRPRAILALSDLLARGAMDAARRMGLAVPRDVSVVGIDDLEGNEAIGLTSVFVPYRPMGELAGVLLASLIDGGAPEVPPPLPTAPAIRTSAAPPA